MSSIQYHPSPETLALFAAGELDSSTSIMVSAHLEFCHECRAQVQLLEEKLSEQIASEPVQNSEPQLDDLLGQLMGQLDSAEQINTEDALPLNEHIAISGKEFVLPRSLQRHHEQIGPWSKLPGKLQRAKVMTHDEAKMNFIYMDSDSALPEHTHQGQEITLVLAGHFEDDHAVYVPGDFIVQTNEHTHTPRTAANQDCLCLTLLNAPLHFTSGLASLLNPFSQLFFR